MSKRQRASCQEKDIPLEIQPKTEKIFYPV